MQNQLSNNDIDSDSEISDSDSTEILDFTDSEVDNLTNTETSEEFINAENIQDKLISVITFSDLLVEMVENFSPGSNVHIGWYNCSTNKPDYSLRSNGYLLFDDNCSIVGRLLVSGMDVVIHSIIMLVGDHNTKWSYTFNVLKPITSYHPKGVIEIFVNQRGLISDIISNNLTQLDNEIIYRNCLKYYTKIYGSNAIFDKSWENPHIITTDITDTQPKMVQLKLFDHQLKTVSWMVKVEEELDKDGGWKFDSSLELNKLLDFTEDIGIKIYFDIIDKAIVINKKPFHLISSYGGISASAIGTGKTLEFIALAASRNIKITSFLSENGHINTRASLVLCPSHLTKQWSREIEKCNPTFKTIIITTKPTHKTVRYNDIINADFVIVSFQFLTNISHYIPYMFEKVTPSTLMNNYNKRISCYNKIIKEKTTNNENIQKLLLENGPILEIFHWDRVAVDEGHEIFGELSSMNSTVNMNNYLKKWMIDIDTRYRWYISGTPFSHTKGFTTAMQYLNLYTNKNVTVDGRTKFVKLSYDEIINEGIPFNFLKNELMKKFYYRNTKESIGTEFNIPPVLEEVIYLELTSVEKSLYNSNKHRGTDYLRQLCCHPQISDHDVSVFGTEEISLGEMQDKLITHNKNLYKNTEKKLEQLEINKPDNETEYKSKKTRYTNDLGKLKHLIDFFEKIDPVVPVSEDDTCPICMCDFDDPVITSCSHYFCRECIVTSLTCGKKECPMCRQPLTPKDIFVVNKSKEDKTVDYLVFRYGSKMGKLIGLCKQILNNPNNRIIIFSYWDRMLHLIGKTLKDNNIKNVYCKGNVHQRNSAIETFRGYNKAKKDVNVIMLSTEHAASGTNLTEATHVILIDPMMGSKSEVKAIENQAIGRAVRLGQKNQVRVIRLIVKNTVEEEIYKASL